MEPGNANELAQALGEAAGRALSIRIGHAPIDADVTISTASMTRVLQYEPKDLTISVEAGMKFADLARLLAENRQTIPLDPGWFDNVTVGGVVAANLSGPRRRLYGTARDLVIGMSFATLEGKLVQSGGMVVKNVAGLDMAKLMIGSYGTLGAIATVNFKLNPIPAGRGTFAHAFASADEAFAMRDRILKSQLQPSAIDILNPQGARRCGFETWTLLVEAPALPARFAQEFGGTAVGDGVWDKVREFVPMFVRDAPDGIVARYAIAPASMKSLVAGLDAAVLARAGNGVVYACCDRESQVKRDAAHVLEHAPVGVERWPNPPAAAFDVMRKVKRMLDPKGLLNKGMLHGRL